MDWKTIERRWPELSGSVLTRWPKADEADVLALDGDRDALVRYVARLEALPVVEAEDRVAEWAETAMPADARMDAAMAGDAISASGAYLPEGEDPSDADEAFGDEDAQGRTIPEPPIGRR